MEVSWNVNEMDTKRFLFFMDNLPLLPALNVLEYLDMKHFINLYKVISPDLFMWEMSRRSANEKLCLDYKDLLEVYSVSDEIFKMEKLRTMIRRSFRNNFELNCEDFSREHLPLCYKNSFDMLKLLIPTLEGDVHLSYTFPSQREYTLLFSVKSQLFDRMKTSLKVRSLTIIDHNLGSGVRTYTYEDKDGNSILLRAFTGKTYETWHIVTNNISFFMDYIKTPDNSYFREWFSNGVDLIDQEKFEETSNTGSFQLSNDTIPKRDSSLIWKTPVWWN